ncbi:DUF732 domain-containing protein [Rhodococcus sp. NPDC003382]|uniref:DUF732 domain-containing protein n=1 Tax=unclassified Rhodococcus (in: high G+C Gram-positive bacteria) TaxID=192944 RepID=UPI0018CCC62C|nr:MULTISPECIES: DUF732 domain-containing protein [unclassified Rhodococcus (in: high G+C Gram-positive bacteria)]MBH0119620.1 DUF732 domain-containing protein [Rhodococcus sp. CX]MCK8671077.1 DUF732 domain-containing protein [Rhodococcus sp. HM1]
MPARTRSRSTRVVGACVAALTAAAVLGACGSDDSTATSTPSATTSATAATTSASATATTGAEGTAAESPAVEAPVTSPGEAATAPPAEPQTAPGFPGPTEVPTDSRDAAFLDALRAEGVEPSGDGSSAINTANYICGAIAQGGSEDEIKTIVTALVGSDAVASGIEITEEQAAETANVYIATAKSTYCS